MNLKAVDDSLVAEPALNSIDSQYGATVELEQSTASIGDQSNLVDRGDNFSKNKTTFISWSPDPIFYAVVLAATAILFLGLSFFYLQSQKFIDQQSSQLNREIAALKTRIAASSALRSEVDAAEDVSQEKAATLVSVQSVGSVVNDLVIEEADIEVEKPVISRQLPELSLQEQIERLQDVVDSQAEQIDLLALENHELRLQNDFGADDKVRTERQLAESSSAADGRQVTLSVVNKRSVAKSTNRNLTDLISHGYKAYHQGDYQSASNSYNEALRLDPHSRDAALGVAAVSAVQGDYELAIDLYWYLLKLNSDDQLAFSSLLSLSDTSKEQTIEADLHQWLASELNDPSAYYSILGDFYSGQQRWADAAMFYSKALGGGQPFAADAWFNFAVSLDNLGRKDEAIGSYRKALASAGSSSFDNAGARARLDILAK